MDAKNARPQETTRTEYKRAVDRLKRYLAARDHSRFELVQKLTRLFAPELVDRVLCEASARGWLAPDAEVATRAALAYERQNKSRGYIEARLRQRHLPLPVLSPAAELDKIRALVERRFGLLAELSETDRPRVVRFLKYRGFEDQLIRQVIHAES